MTENYIVKVINVLSSICNNQNESIQNLHQITKNQQKSINSLRTNVMILIFSIVIIAITTFIHLFTSIYKGT